MTMFWKKLTFDLLAGSGTWGSAGKIVATMLLHFVIPFNWICIMTMFWKGWILTYWPGQGRVYVCVSGSADKIFATMLLHFVIPFNLICNMTMFWKSWIMTYCPITRVLGEGVCGQNIFYLVAVFVILFNLICTVTIFWKSWTLIYWPHPQGRGWLRAKYLLPWCCICDYL